MLNADLRNAELLAAKLDGSYLQGAQLQGARYDTETEWPTTFDFGAAGATPLDI